MVIDNFDRELKRYREVHVKLQTFAIYTLRLHNSGDKILESIKHNRYLYFDHIKYYEDIKTIIIWFKYQHKNKSELSNVWIDVNEFKEWYLTNYGNGTTKQD